MGSKTAIKEKTPARAEEELAIPAGERAAVEAELEAIRRADGGTLDPRRVVSFARDPKTALHAHFEWDDTEAAENYRIAQARQIIRVCVTVIPQGERQIEVRTYQSLPSDRGVAGYRRTEDILTSAVQREELLSVALRELRRIRQQYAVVKELAGVWAHIDEMEG